jgi:hypothetical protein
MITNAERAYILEHAYVPEHLPYYVTAISQTEPFLVRDFVIHTSGNMLIFIGYPLREPFNEPGMLEALSEARTRFQPKTTSIVAPKYPLTLEDFTPASTDAYYRIDLTQLSIPHKTRNMLARARQEVTVAPGHFGREHKKLIDKFLRIHPVDEATRFIFLHIDKYVKCDTAQIFDARNIHGDLVAFDVAEFGAKNYAFYMFNFRSCRHKVPGASDLLLAHLLEHTKERGQRYLNLGLGINAGINFFKKKWRAESFLDYISASQAAGPTQSWGEIFDQLTGF